MDYQYVPNTKSINKMKQRWAADSKIWKISTITFLSDYEPRNSSFLSDYEPRNSSFLSDYEPRNSFFLSDYEPRNSTFLSDYEPRNSTFLSDYEPRNSAFLSDYEPRNYFYTRGITPLFLLWKIGFPSQKFLETSIFFTSFHSGWGVWYFK